MMALTKIHRASAGISTTKGSDKNSRKKRRTAGFVAAAGVPGLGHNMPVRFMMGQGYQTSG